jgi:hypothetical protein
MYTLLDVPVTYPKELEHGLRRQCFIKLVLPDDYPRGFAQMRSFVLTALV